MAAARTLRAALLAAVLAASCVQAFAAAPPAAAHIDGVPVHAFTVDTLWQQQRAGQPDLARRAVLDQVIAARLLATHAPRATDGSVGFAQDAALDGRLVAALREVHGVSLDAAVRALPGASLNGLIVGEARIPPAAWQAIFGKPGALRLEIALLAAQQAQAAQLEVLRYRLPGGAERAFSLLDIYQRQNVQGRVALSQQVPGFLAQQARLALAAEFSLHWARERFGADAVADLRRAIGEREAMAALERLHGIGIDTDSGSDLLNRLAAAATASEVAAYYRQHKESFSRIERVRARHIRLPDEALARQAASELQAGADFAATARRHSRAADAGKGGDLGWIGAGRAHDWLASFAFSQQPGKPSAPIRAPVGPHDEAYWEIVLVENRVQGYHPPGSETVRYIASRAIAREKALRQLRSQREQALRSARIDIAGQP